MPLYHVPWRVWRLLSPEGRRWIPRIWALLIAATVIELLNLGAWYPFVAALTDKSAIHQQPLIRALHQFFGFEREIHFVSFLGAGVLALQMVCLAVKALSVWSIGRFGAQEKVHLAHRLLRTYTGQPHEWLLTKNTGELHRIVVNESNLVVERFVVTALQISMEALLASIVCILLLLIDPWIAIVSTVLIGSMFGAIYRRIRPRLQLAGEVIHRAGVNMHLAALEALSAAKEGRLPPVRQHLVDRVQAHHQELEEVTLTGKLIGDIPGMLTETTAKAGILVVALYLITRGSTDVLPLIALYVVCVVRVAPEAHAIYRELSKMRQCVPILERIDHDLNETLPPACNTRLELTKSIELVDLRFRYAGTTVDVVQDIRLEIPRNTSVALVGSTGAGKTTLADLIAGLLVPVEGEVRVDGVSLDTYRRLAWRNNIGYVPQSIYLTDDTIRRNIAFGIPEGEIDEVAVKRAATLAHIHHFIEGLPDGYSTFLGERGVSISGGQRQRIGIARALYHDPAVLILDEATSALDNITERAILDALEELAGKKTVLVIAHRLTTVMGCDLICLLHEGRIAARGTFRELEQSSDVFRAMAAVFERTAPAGALAGR